MDEKIKKRVVAAVGSAAELARALGVKRQAVSQWRQIPPKHVLKIEQITGISRHVLRPDYYPPEDRAA